MSPNTAEASWLYGRLLRRARTACDETHPVGRGLSFAMYGDTSQRCYANHQLQETVHCHRRCLCTRSRYCRHRPRTCPRARQRTARDRREPLFLFGIQGEPEDTQGRLLYTLGDGQWDIPKLRVLLEKIIPENGVMEGYEVEHEFPDLGHRTMCLNARQVFYEEGADTTILLGMEDVTERLVLEREKDDLLRQKDVLLEEMEHRIANSLQIIASIILMKARAVNSEETRLHLQDAHKRVMSVAAVQKQLHASGATGSVEIVALSLKVVRDSCNLDDRRHAADLVESGRRRRQCHIPSGRESRLDRDRTRHECSETRIPRRKIGGQIIVAYEVAGTNWKLSVSDNGIGKPDGVFAQPKTGLGTGIVKALAQQLNAQVETLAGPRARPFRSLMPLSRRRKSAPRKWRHEPLVICPLLALGGHRLLHCIWPLSVKTDTIYCGVYVRL